MDTLRGMADQFGGGGLESQLQDIQFPASKDQVISHLEDRGVPSQITDRLREVDTSQFGSADEVISKLKSFL